RSVPCDRRAAILGRLGGAELHQALRRLDLGRGADDGAGRGALAQRPPVPGGGRGAGAGAGGGGMIRLALLLWLLALPVWAVEPSEVLADPALEARARQLSAMLRCPVCQSESIDESSAPVAADLRRLVRERLLAGDSDAAVLAHVTDRYGEFVLFRPPARGA